MENKTKILKDLANRKLYVTREFNAPVEKVWKAWTDSSLLDKWWAPKPWKAETQIMDMRVGGLWIYSMVGPNGDRSWSLAEFKTVNPEKGFAYSCAFCDKDGNIDDSFPKMDWLIEFKTTAAGTKVEVELTFNKAADMEKLVAMGFEGGFTMGLNNLEELLKE